MPLRLPLYINSYVVIFMIPKIDKIGFEDGLTERDLETSVCKSREGRSIKFSNYAFDPQVDFNIKISNYDMDYDFTVFHDSKIFSLGQPLSIYFCTSSVSTTK